MDVRISHAVYERLRTIFRPHVEERTGIPNGLEEELGKLDRMGGGAFAVSLE